MENVIKAENLSKLYRLGEIGTGTITQDFERFVTTKILKKEDPFKRIGEENNREENGVGNIVYSLKDVSFEVEKGDAVGIIGRNGAGKSTLLKLLSRVTSPSSGKVFLNGRVASLLEVGTGFHPELTGRENIYLNGAILGMRKKEIDRRFDEIVDFSGVERYVDTPVKRYSSGMYVRLAFAVAAHLESEILIVDEVLAVGDAEFQKKCLGKMSDVTYSLGKTVLFVSHNMTSIQNLCNKSMLLSNGQLSCYSSTDSVINEYFSSNKKRNIDIIKKSQYLDFEFRILNSNLNKIDNIKCGEGYYFELDINPYQAINNFNITIVILNGFEQRVLSFDTRFQCSNVIRLDRSLRIRMSCDENLLTPGSYEIQVGIYDNFEFLTSWENVSEFNVIESDYYGTGKLPDMGQGNILPKSSWSIEKL